MPVYTYTTLDDPLATIETFAQGINGSGQIVGYYYAQASNSFQGFLRLIAPALEQAPGGFGNALSAADRAVGGSIEVAVVGDQTAARPLLEAAWRPYVPNRVLAAGPAGTADPALLAGRTLVGGAAAAYVCRNFTCELPVTDPNPLSEQLRVAN